MNVKINNKAVIILPTYNEAKNIELMVKDIMSELTDISIVVVDDNSPDGTAKIVKMMILDFPNLFLIERPIRTGLGDAYKDAISKILGFPQNFDFFITMDADGSHQPKYLKNFLEEAKTHDLIIGSRYIKGGDVENWEFWRMMLSKFGNLYSRALTGMKVSDTTSGFMCIRRGLLQRVDFRKISSAGYAYLIEFKFCCINEFEAKFKETPIVFKERGRGESKISKRIIIEGVKAPIKIFLNRLFKKNTKNV